MAWWESPTGNPWRSGADAYYSTGESTGFDAWQMEYEGPTGPTLPAATPPEPTPAPVVAPPAPVETIQPEPLFAEPAAIEPAPEPLDFTASDENFDPTAWGYEDVWGSEDLPPPEPEGMLPDETAAYMPWDEFTAPPPEEEPGRLDAADDYLTVKGPPSPEAATPGIDEEGLSDYLKASPTERKARWMEAFTGPEGSRALGDLNPEMVIFDDLGNPVDYLDYGEEKPGKSLVELSARRDKAQADLDAAQTRLSKAVEEMDTDNIPLLEASVKAAESDVTLSEADLERFGTTETLGKPKATKEQLAADIESTRQLRDAQLARAAYLEASPGGRSVNAFQRQLAATDAAIDRSEIAMQAAQARIATAQTQQAHIAAVTAYRQAEATNQAASNKRRMLEASAPAMMADLRTRAAGTAAVLRKAATDNTAKLDQLMADYKVASRLDPFNAFLQSTAWLRDASVAHAEDDKAQQAFLGVIRDQLRPGLEQELQPAGEGAPFGQSVITVDVPLEYDNTGNRTAENIMLSELPFVGHVFNVGRKGKRTQRLNMPAVLDPRDSEVALKAAAERTAKWVERLGVPVQKWTPEQRSMVVNAMRKEVLADPAVQAAWDRVQSKASEDIRIAASRAYDADLLLNAGELTGLAKFPVQVAGTALELLDKATSFSNVDTDAAVIASVVNAYNATEIRTAQAEGREPVLKKMADFQMNAHFLAGVGRSLKGWNSTDAFAKSWLASADMVSQLKAQTPEDAASQLAGEEFGAVMGSMALTPATASLLLKACGLGRVAAAGGYAARTAIGVSEATAFSGLEGVRTGSVQTFQDDMLVTVPLVLGLGALGELGRATKIVTRAGAAATRLGQTVSDVTKNTWVRKTAERFASEEGAWNVGQIKAAFQRATDNAIPLRPLTDADVAKAVAGMSHDLLLQTAKVTGTPVRVPKGPKYPKGKARDIDWLRKDIVNNVSGDQAAMRKVADAYNRELAGASLQEARAALGQSPVLKHEWLNDPNLSPKDRAAILAVQNSAADLFVSTETRAIPQAYDTLVTALGPMAEAIETKARTPQGARIPTARMIVDGYRDAGTDMRANYATYREGLGKALLDTGLVNKLGGVDIKKMVNVAKAIEGRLDPGVVLSAEETAAKDAILALNRRMFADTAAEGIGVRQGGTTRASQMNPDKYVPMHWKPEIYADIKAGGKRLESRIDELMATLRDADGNVVLVGEAGRAKAEKIFASLKQAPTLADWINDPQGGGLFAREFGRIPDTMRDLNLARVFTNQIRHVSQEVGMARAFGADRQKLTDLLNMTQQSIGGEKGAAWREFIQDYLINPIQGKVKGYNRGVGLFGQVSQLEYLTKIGLNANVTLAQLAQPWIASVGATGLKRTTAAALQTIYHAVTRDADWALMKTSGAVSHSIMDLAADMVYDVPLAGVKNLGQRVAYGISQPFQSGDAWARYVSATAGYGKAQDAIRFLRGDYSFFERAYRQAYGDTPLFNTAKAKAQVRDWLERWTGLKNVDEIVSRSGPSGKWAGFTQEEARRLMGRFVERTNFTGDILALPYWARHTPLARIATMFGSFGYQQMGLAGKSIGAAARKGAIGAVPAMAGVLTGSYLAGDYMTRVGNMLAGRDEQTQTMAANVLGRLMASSFAGILGTVSDKAKHGLTFPVASDLLALRNSIAGAFDAAYEGDSVGTVLTTLLRSHIPLVRHAGGIADVVDWAYEKATGKETERLDARAYADALGLYSHVRTVQAQPSPLQAIMADLSDNSIGDGKLYHAFSERNRNRLREYLDTKLDEKGGDTEKLAASLSTSLTTASPVLKLLQLNAQDAVDLANRTPGLREKQARAVRHYLNYVSWVRDETLQWAHDNADKFGWDTSRIAAPGGPLSVHVGPIKRSDFDNAPFFQTMPKTWLALDGERPDSWVVPMNNTRFAGPITDQLMDEIQALDAYERYIPPAAMRKMFRLPPIQSYRDRVPAKVGYLSQGGGVKK